MEHASVSRSATNEDGRVQKSKKSVNFAGRDESAAVQRSGASTSMGARRALDRSESSANPVRRDKAATSSLASLLAGEESPVMASKSTTNSKRAARNRKRMLRRLVQRLSPRYWLHVLDKTLPIIHPESLGRTCWDFFMLALVVYVCFMEPYSIGFGFTPLDLSIITRPPPSSMSSPPPPPPSPPPMPPAPDMGPPFETVDKSWEQAMLGLDVFSYIIDACFWSDLLSNFRTAFVDHTATLIRSGPEIAINYLKGWFTIDLLACVPFDSIVMLFVKDLSTAQLSALMLLRTLRLLRLARLLRVLERMKKGNLIRLIKLLFFIMLVVHWLTCLWFFMYRMLRDTIGLPWTFDLQIGHSPATFTYFLQGYLNTFVLMIGNDINPGNDIEKLYACFVLGLGACFYAIIMGSISLLVNNLDPTASRHRLKRDIINNAIRYLGIKGKVVERISQYFDYLLQRNHPGPDGMLAVSQLPTSMFRDISSWMYEDHVKKVPLFKDCEEAFIRHLVMRLRLQVYLEGEVIFRMGDVGHEMYFITKGHVAVLNSYKELLAVLPAGGFFGELGLLATAHRTAHCVALCDCDLNLLVATDLMNAMNSFPDSARIVRERAIKRLSELQTAGKADVNASGAPRHLQRLQSAAMGPSKLQEAAAPQQAQHQAGFGGGAESVLQSGKQRAGLAAVDEQELDEAAEGKATDAPDNGSVLEDSEAEFSQEDTMALLERVTLTVSQITVRLEAVHSGIYDINGRLVKVDAAPTPGTEFGAAAPTTNLDMGLDGLDGY